MYITADENSDDSTYKGLRYTKTCRNVIYYVTQHLLTSTSLRTHVARSLLALSLATSIMRPFAAYHLSRPDKCA